MTYPRSSGKRSAVPTTLHTSERPDGAFVTPDDNRIATEVRNRVRLVAQFRRHFRGLPY